MTKKEIFDYISETPENTNMSILNQFLDELLDSKEGNPNYVETIEGTLANPWGELNYSKLRDEINNKNATISLYVDHATLIGILFDRNILFGSCLFDMPTDDKPLLAGSIAYDSNGDLLYAKMLGGSSWNDIPENASCALIIIHHSLPTSGS